MRQKYQGLHKRENRAADPTIKFSETLNLSWRKASNELHQSTRQGSLERDSNKSLERTKRPSLCETLIKAPVRSNSKIYLTHTNKSRSALKTDPDPQDDQYLPTEKILHSLFGEKIKRRNIQGIDYLR